ncbi:MAG: DUF5606 domain-containing protein [Cytophagaceae bacterium]
MDLKEIASVSGKGGVFKVVKPTRNGVILETIDEQKNKIIATASNRVSLLKEISIYTTNKEGSVPLEDVFENIFKKHGGELPVDVKSGTEELQNFMSEVLPDFDRERVYASDMKKLVAWYNTLHTFMPEIFTNKEEKKEKTTEAKEEKKSKVKEEKASSEKAPKAAKTKSSAKK